MEIILVRHGRPQKAGNTLLNAAGFANWVKNYNQSLVSDQSLPCKLSQVKYNEHYLVSSDLPRAVHSCSIFSGSPPHYQRKRVGHFSLCFIRDNDDKLRTVQVSTNSRWKVQKR